MQGHNKLRRALTVGEVYILLTSPGLLAAWMGKQLAPQLVQIHASQALIASATWIIFAFGSSALACSRARVPLLMATFPASSLFIVQTFGVQAGLDVFTRLLLFLSSILVGGLWWFRRAPALTSTGPQC